MPVCPECHVTYSGAQGSGGHCRGGPYGGCCLTFRTQGAADAHRVGVHDPRDKQYAANPRRCLTTEEMVGMGFRLTDRGWTNNPPSTRWSTVEAVSGPAIPEVPGTVEMPGNPARGTLLGHLRRRLGR